MYELIFAHKYVLRILLKNNISEGIDPLAEAHLERGRFRIRSNTTLT